MKAKHYHGAASNARLLPVMPAFISILDFAYKIGFKNLYDWQERILLRYESGSPVAVAACNFSGKTSTVFVITALWTLYNFPWARVQYVSSTFPQVKLQYFQSIKRLASHPMFTGWGWFETEIRHPEGGIIFGRATGEGGNIEGIHDEPGSPAALLVDEAKSVDDSVMDAFSRCHTTFRLFASSTGQATGEFYKIMTDTAHLWKTFRVTSSDCPHISPAEIGQDKAHLKDSVFRIKHSCEWLYDAGDSIISLEHVRRLLANQAQGKLIPKGYGESADGVSGGNLAVLPESNTPTPVDRGLNAQGIPIADVERYEALFPTVPPNHTNEHLVRPTYPGFVPGPASQNGPPSTRLRAFCNFAAGGQCESALGLCDGNAAWVEGFCRLSDSM